MLIFVFCFSLLSDSWQGTKRIDYALYSLEGLSNFPINALSHLTGRDPKVWAGAVDIVSKNIY